MFVKKKKKKSDKIVVSEPGKLNSPKILKFTLKVN